MLTQQPIFVMLAYICHCSLAMLFLVTWMRVVVSQIMMDSAFVCQADP
jgi:hypothetical protein